MAREESDSRLLTDPRLLAIVLASGVGVFGNQAVPPVLPSIGTALALSDAEIGLVMTVFFVGVMVAIPVGGVTADIYGRRPVVLTSLLLFGVSGVGAFFADSLAELLVARLVQGLGIAGTTGLSVALIGDFYEGPRGTTAQGIRASTNGSMVILAPAIAGAVAAIGWQYAFLLYAAAFPALVLVYLYLPEGTEVADDAAEPGNDEPAGGPDTSVSLGTELRRYAASMLDSLNDRNLAVLVAGGFTLFFLRYGVLTIVPLLATRELGAGPAVLGLTLSVLGVVRVVVSPLSGRMLTLLSRKQAFGATMGVVALSMGLLAVVPDVPSLAGALAVFAVGMSLFNPVLNDTVTATAPTENRAGVVSGMQTAKSIANTAAPTLFTLLLTLTDFPVVFLAGGVVALAYVALVAAGLESAAY